MTQSAEIISKLTQCEECQRVLFSGESICARCVDLRERGVDVTSVCGCGESHTIKILPGERPPKYQCAQCAAAERAEETALAESLEKTKREAIKIRRTRYLAKNIPPLFADANIATVSPDSRKHLDKSTFLIFGDYGTGKTYAAYALARQLYETGAIKNFTITRACRLLINLKSSLARGGYDEIFRNLTHADLLIIDEWGKNHGTDYEESVLFEIINTRYEYDRRTGIIVNASTRNDLLRLIRPDVLDRFRAGIVEINGRSRRKK